MHGPTETVIDRCPGLHLEPSSKIFPAHSHTDDLPILVVETPLCQAHIALQGAQLLEFSDASGQSLLWLSPATKFVKGKALRGGIPVCLPWFSKLADQPEKPQHGFLRDEDWQLSDASTEPDQTVTLTWNHQNYRNQPHPMFDWRFSASLRMRLGTSLELELEVINHDQTPMPLTWALHSYHPVDRLSQTSVSGLENCEYLDNTQALARKRQEGTISFGEEFDRIYLNVPKKQVITGKPGLRVCAENCHSAIVWNPGKTRASGMPDLGAENFDQFICLERGNAADNRLLLAPGEIHRASVTITAA